MFWRHHPLLRVSQNVANKEEAEKCLEIAKVVLSTRFILLIYAKKYFAAAEYEKAIKFLDKSLRLYPISGLDLSFLR
jgi:hypothetical protein